MTLFSGFLGYGEYPIHGGTTIYYKTTSSSFDIHLISHLLSEMSRSAVCATVLLVIAIADFSSAGSKLVLA